MAYAILIDFLIADCADYMENFAVVEKRSFG
jgi:hypothetical protein